MQPQKRLVEIDLLRGLAMLVMIFLHTSVYFFSNGSYVAWLWNWGHFAVPVFIFCSVFLFFYKSQKFSFSYLKKRLWRLLFPYYIFVFLFLIAVSIREPAKFNAGYI